ncbi:unnamed protein product (macronuclear) [Paramecium tetraurelia]|uniref:Uncharacterized protein n=1 Tax=Paramecium tetraurelia TaxID=5888 RepID=A0CZ64_PARTE|nr:uncharacterized protein GSPATT00039122001 [Paramecium tetraurelia]CAK76081.1 unnamed protein product [Paramecium tetraurelia]
MKNLKLNKDKILSEINTDSCRRRGGEIERLEEKGDDKERE